MLRAKGMDQVRVSFIQDLDGNPGDFEVVEIPFVVPRGMGHYATQAMIKGLIENFARPVDGPEAHGDTLRGANLHVGEFIQKIAPQLRAASEKIRAEAAAQKPAPIQPAPEPTPEPPRGEPKVTVLVSGGKKKRRLPAKKAKKKRR